MAIIIDFTAAVGVRNHLYRVSIRILFFVRYPGEVHSLKDNAGDGNYGPTILITRMSASRRRSQISPATIAVA